MGVGGEISKTGTDEKCAVPNLGDKVRAANVVLGVLGESIALVTSMSIVKTVGQVKMHRLSTLNIITP